MSSHAEQFRGIPLIQPTDRLNYALDILSGPFTRVPDLGVARFHCALDTALNKDRGFTIVNGQPDIKPLDYFRAAGFYHLGIWVEYRNPSFENIRTTVKLPGSDITLTTDLLLDENHSADDLEEDEEEALEDLGSEYALYGKYYGVSDIWTPEDPSLMLPPSYFVRDNPEELYNHLFAFSTRMIIPPSY